MPAKRAKSLKKPILSILVPVYNEKSLVVAVLEAVAAAKLRKYEVIVVDDASTDGTLSVLKKHAHLYTKLIPHRKNLGKSAAVQTALNAAHGEIVVIQDADQEYDPRDIAQLIEPIVEGRADVVYGSRFKGHLPHRMVYFTHYLVNLGLTFFTNIVTNLNLSDMETGYKAVRKQLLESIVLEESGFGIEPELTIKLATAKARFYEIGIRYYGRTYEEGKKIGFDDGVQALWVIIKHGVIKRLQSVLFSV